MFTGLIKELGTVESINLSSTGATLKIKAPVTSNEAVIGDSICVNGVCLTVVEISKDEIVFELSHETLKATNLGGLKKGSPVNLEPSLKATDPLGGHIVTGHVDGVGQIVAKRQIGQNWEITIKVSKTLADYMVEKGSVAVDGISLTIVEVGIDTFKVVIIPHTAKVTTIGKKNVGDTVNIETDIIGKYVARFLSNKQSSSLLDKLKEGGFIS